MFSSAQSPSEKNNQRNIYQKFQSFLGRGSDSRKDTMMSTQTAASEDNFVTPVSSVGDLLNMSPKHSDDILDQSNMTGDLLTGTEFDSICDVTMHEVPVYDDMYIDATSMDYLVKCTESNRHHTTVDRGKESLFVKFDPLYAHPPRRVSSAESNSDSVECDVGYETGSSASMLADNHVSLPKQTMSAGIVQNNKDKPMQVVPPVVNELPKPIVVQTRSTPVLVRSVSAILTPTQVATDRLISISDNTPPTAAPRSPRLNAAANVDRLHSLRIILQKQDNEIMELTLENRELKSSLNEYKNRYSQTVEEFENKIKRMSDERDNLLERENKLLQQINDKIMSNKKMSIVMEEYEKTISSLIGEQAQAQEKQQQEKMQYEILEERLTAEKDQALNHLGNMESSFNDLLTKYEKCKSIILEFKDREKVYEQKVTDYETDIKKYEQLYDHLKQVTKETLNNANETLDNTKKNYTLEIMKLNATIKKNEINIASLQETLTQKTRDNEELTRICDQLINGVS